LLPRSHLAEARFSAHVPKITVLRGACAKRHAARVAVAVRMAARSRMAARQEVNLRLANQAAKALARSTEVSANKWRQDNADMQAELTTLRNLQESAGSAVGQLREENLRLRITSRNVLGLMVTDCVAVPVTLNY
jgi:hypothetical protein